MRLKVVELTDDECLYLKRAVETSQRAAYSYVGSALLSKLSPQADTAKTVVALRQIAESILGDTQHLRDIAGWALETIGDRLPSRLTEGSPDPVDTTDEEHSS